VRIWRAFSRLISGSGRLAAWSLAFSIAQSVALIPIALLVRQAFDDAIPNGDRTELVLLGAAILALYLLSLGLGLVGRAVVLRVTKPAVARVRADVVERVIWLPAEFYDASDGARLHALIVQDSERLDAMAKSLLAIVIPSLGTAILLIASLAAIQPLLLAVVLVTVPPLALVHRVARGPLRRRAREWQESADAFSAGVLATLQSALLVKIMTAEERATESAREDAAELGRTGQRLGWVQQAYGLGQVALGGIAGVVVLVAGGLAVVSDSISLGDLIAFMAVLALARGQLNWVVATVPDMVNGLAAIERIDEVLENTQREPYSGGRRIELAGAVSWREVSFGYAEGQPPVLDRVSLELGLGETVALLGPTGAGKTTLVALLLGLYRPWSGTVAVDAVPLEELDVRDLRRQLGVLAQERSAVRGTVRENIAFGRPGADAAAVERAAELAAAVDFIARLPNGFETELGDEGARLSAGQRQRIALARALLGSPRLLLLDEPTSHLDPASAEAVLDNLAGLEPRPTLLLVTHDPRVAARADRTVEVRGGGIELAPLAGAQ
jgi:ATP-binding cassette subfamily B protein